MAGGAVQSRTSRADRVYAWQLHHKFSAVESLRRLFHNPVSSLLTWLVIGVALAMPLGLGLALENARRVSVGWDSPAQISLFLRGEVSVDAAEALRTRLAAREDVAAAMLISREQALTEFRQLSGFGDVLQQLDENPLPNLVVVTPASGRLNPAGVAALHSALKTEPGVERAVLDMEWVQRLNAMVRVSQRFVWALGLILAAGVLLVLGNTIRLAIENRRDEIVVIKLVGGSNAFVRRPFLYTGFWYGLGGAVCAWGMVAATLWWLREPFESLALLYQSGATLEGLGPRGGLLLLVGGGTLGLLGAWLALARHLSAIEPQ